MDIGNFDGIDFGPAPRSTKNAAVVLGMTRITVEQMPDGLRARLTCPEGHEATYSGLREVVAWDGEDWQPIEPEEGAVIQHDRPEADLQAQLGRDGVLRTWEAEHR